MTVSGGLKDSRVAGSDTARSRRCHRLHTNLSYVTAWNALIYDFTNGSDLACLLCITPTPPRAIPPTELRLVEPLLEKCSDLDVGP